VIFNQDSGPGGKTKASSSSQTDKNLRPLRLVESEMLVSLMYLIWLLDRKLINSSQSFFNRLLWI
jgi:hypothetical protein